MDFDDSCYYVDVIDECVTHFVQEALWEDSVHEILEEEPPGEVVSKKDNRVNKTDSPPRRKWWKRVGTQKKMSPSPLRKNMGASLQSLLENVS